MTLHLRQQQMSCSLDRLCKLRAGARVRAQAYAQGQARRARRKVRRGRQVVGRLASGIVRRIFFRVHQSKHFHGAANT